MVLSDAILLSMWRVGMLLSCVHLKWVEFQTTFGPKLYFMRQRPIRKPPDPKNKWERILQEFNQREEALGKRRTMYERLFNIHTKQRKRYMMLALNAAIILARKQPTILTSETKNLSNYLRKYKRNGQLLVGKINKDEVRLRLRKIIADEPLGLLSHNGDFDLIIDTGCTKTATSFPEDFLPNTLVNLERPIRMDGIAGGLDIKQEGKVRYEIVDDNGEIQEIVVDAFYIPKLGCRLFSPQAYFRQLHDEGIDEEGKCQMVVKYDKATIELVNSSKISLHYDTITHLPRVKAFKSALSSATALAMNGCVTKETNQNLSPQQKILLKWHF